MSARRLVATALLALAAGAGCRRGDAETPEQMQARIDVLLRERDQLRARQNEMVTKDPRLMGMPTNGVRVGIPTPLVRTLVQRVLTGFVDSVTLKLTRLKVHKAGTVKKIVTIGTYDLNVVIDEVTGRLETGEATLGFGGDQITVALPVKVKSGTGDATIDFTWDGKNVSGAVCGDMEITQDVSGGVKPASYPVSGSLILTATAKEILAQPKFPLIKINLKVAPSDESWGAVQKILDDKEGVCGYVVDKVNILKIVEGLINKGFNVRLPTEKIKPMAVPVGIEPSMKVQGRQVDLAIKLGELAITNDMIWLGANVHVDVGEAGSAAASSSPSPSPTANAAAPAKPGASPAAVPPKASPKAAPKATPKPSKADQKAAP